MHDFLHCNVSHSENSSIISVREINTAAAFMHVQSSTSFTSRTQYRVRKWDDEFKCGTKASVGYFSQTKLIITQNRNTTEVINFKLSAFRV